MQKAGNLGIPPKSTTVPGSRFFLGGDGFSCIHMSTHIFHPRFFFACRRYEISTHSAKAIFSLFHSPPSFFESSRKLAAKTTSKLVCLGRQSKFSFSGFRPDFHLANFWFVFLEEG